LGEEAQRSVARELVLEAAAEELGLEVSDDDVESLVREQAGIVGDDADTTIERLRETGRFETLREDLRLRNALDRVASEVKRIPRELADAREALWTPEKEKQPTDANLWTPGSEQQHRPPVEPHHPIRHRADLPRLAVLRHLLAAVERTHHLPRDADRRRGEPDRRADDPPRVRGSRQGHSALHQ